MSFVSFFRVCSISVSLLSPAEGLNAAAVATGASLRLSALFFSRGAGLSLEISDGNPHPISYASAVVASPARCILALQPGALIGGRGRPTGGCLAQ